MSNALIDGAYALITSVDRNIGGIIPDIVIEETGTDILKITDHPVEIGASITDHSYKMPVERIMRIGCSDSSPGGFEGRSAAIYAMLIALQGSREPFDVSTGKRFYRNMLLSILSETTDHTTEHALIATVALREVILTYTQMGSTNNQQNPSQTSNPSNRGEVSPQVSNTAPTYAQVVDLRGRAEAVALARGERPL